MNASSDSYALAIATDETNALILGEALADWNLGIHLPDGAGPATIKPAVRSAYVARGFAERESLILEGWKTGCFCRI